MAEELATAILAECSKCGRGAGNRNFFWAECSKFGREAGGDRKTFGGICNVASMGTSGKTVPLWMKMLFQWHFQVYVLYTFDITINLSFYVI